MTVGNLRKRLVFSIGLTVFATGCVDARSVCEMECECEHCNDFELDVECLQLEIQEANAEAYECDDKWQEYMTCISDKGTCDETEARFSTNEPGTCSGSQPVGMSCTTNADCNVFGDASCLSGSCVFRTCGDSGVNCTSDADCVHAGPNQCADARDAVVDCVDKAGGSLDGNF